MTKHKKLLDKNQNQNSSIINKGHPTVLDRGRPPSPAVRGGQSPEGNSHPQYIAGLTQSDGSFFISTS